MPYALEETISKAPIEGGIEISSEQYAQAFVAKMSGKVVKVVDGLLDLDWQAPEPDPAPEPEPVDPLTLTLTKRQVNAALILSGITDPDGFIETAVAAIEDDTQRALALNDWRHAPYYEREHPLFNNPAMLGATEMSDQEIDDLWILATQQPL